jgi:hypothetical protein
VNIVDGPGGGVNIVDDAVNMRTWPCCDQCGVCNRRNPPECQCMDIMFQGCHPRCRNCIKYVSSREPPVYRCGDNLTNFCRRRCSPTGPIWMNEWIPAGDISDDRFFLSVWNKNAWCFVCTSSSYPTVLRIKSCTCSNLCWSTGV